MGEEQLIFQAEMTPSLSIKRIVNFPVTSNCFIITCEKSNECVLVDPACGTGEMLQSYIALAKIIPVYIILTHEHFDHISSVEYLRELHGCKVIASDICSSSIGNAKKNLSLFYDQVGFTCNPANIIIESEADFIWNDFIFHFHLTPGHSEGSICFSIENYLFSGDTIMNGYKPVTKLPGGNKQKLDISVNRLLSLYRNSATVYPGHGDMFQLADLTN